MGDNASFLERLLPAVGDLVSDRYLLGKELGRGGFGVVFRATHQALNEDVALKIMLPHVVSNTEFVDRFEREVMVAKALRHPNTINVLDYGRTEQELPFFVMEFVRGDSLHELLQLNVRLSMARTQRIAIQILKSLAEAHANGVVHRDMKPANVMLCEIYGERDFVKVLDFGIAKALSDPDSPNGFTQSGMLLGTPSYMSPEQARGIREIDGRSDLYAIGLLIAECIAGRPVVPNGPTVDMLRTLASAEPVTLPAIVEHSPLIGVVRKAVEKDRDARFLNAESMIEALQTLVGLPETMVTDKMMGDALTPLPTPAPPSPTPGLAVSSAPISAQASPLGVARRDTVSEQIEQPIASSVPAPSEPVGLPPKTTPMPAMMVGEADPAARTRMSIEMAPVSPPSRKLPLTLLVVFLVAAAGVAFVLFDGRDGDDGSGPTEGGEGIAAATETPEEAGEPDQPQLPVDEATPNPVPDTPVATTELAEEAEQAAINLIATIGEAHTRLASALPASHTIRFEGTEGAVVKIGEQTLGEVPFEMTVPTLDASLEVVADRRGHRSSRQSVSLLDEVVTVSLRRRASQSSQTVATADDNSEPSEPVENSEEPESDEGDEEPGVPAFGTIRIDRE